MSLCLDKEIASCFAVGWVKGKRVRVYWMIMFELNALHDELLLTKQLKIQHAWGARKT